jgi:ribulokinase
MGRPVLVGIDGGTEGLRVGVYDLKGQECAFHSAAYPTHFPQPGRAEQEPDDWWGALCQALPQALRKAGATGGDIVAIGVDTTCCTVCCLDTEGQPLRPALMWMDVRAGEEAAAVLETGDGALAVNNSGAGPVSAEWMIPKALWIKRNQPSVYARAATVCEYQDYLNFRLTGQMTASRNNTGVRWHYRHDGEGVPLSLLAALGAEELAEKWPMRTVAPGEAIGPLSAVAAEALGLPRDIPVVQGGADAFIAMAGLGVVRPGAMALVTGSSHLQLAVTETAVHGRGMWGAYADVLRPDSFVVEGGQTSTGSAIAWFRRHLAPGISYAELDREATDVPIGCDGLVAQDHFQGNRTPYTDAASRGAFVGLSLRHGRGHMFRALLDGVAYGTRLILETLETHGIAIDDITVCGGVTRSRLWTKIHADALGLPIRVADTACAPALGSAVFAAIGAGHFPDLDAASAAMVHTSRIVEPDKHDHAAHGEAYAAYRRAYPALGQLRQS